MESRYAQLKFIHSFPFLTNNNDDDDDDVAIEHEMRSFLFFILVKLKFILLTTVANYLYTEFEQTVAHYA